MAIVLAALAARPGPARKRLTQSSRSRVGVVLRATSAEPAQSPDHQPGRSHRPDHPELDEHPSGHVPVRVQPGVGLHGESGQEDGQGDCIERAIAPRGGGEIAPKPSPPPCRRPCREIHRHLRPPGTGYGGEGLAFG